MKRASNGNSKRYSQVMYSRFLLGAMGAILAGCAQFPVQQPVTFEQVNAWLVEQQYGKALTALENLPADTPQRAQLLAMRTQIQERARNYENTTLALVRDQEQDQEFGAALSQLRVARHNYPQSVALAEEEQQLLPLQQHALHELNDRLLIVRTQHLFDELSLQERVAHIDPDFPATRLQDIHTQLKRAAGELLECGQRSMQAGKLQRAEQCLTFAQRIQDTQIARTALASLEQQQSERKKITRTRQQRSQDKLRRQQLDQMLTMANQALARDDLPAARQALNDALEIDSDNSDAIALRATIDSAIAARVDIALSKGNQLYRSGNIAQAQRVWKEGLLLDPDQPQLRANVERAARVLQNLQAIQQRTPTPQP